MLYFSRPRTSLYGVDAYVVLFNGIRNKTQAYDLLKENHNLKATSCSVAKMMSSGYTSLDNQNVSGSVPAVSGPDHVELRFPESNLQTFPPSETQGKITGTFRPPSDADDTFSKPGPGGQDDNQSSGWQRYFSVTPYQPYFNVDTSDVLERIRDSLVPYKGTFAEKTLHNPDLLSTFVIRIRNLPKIQTRGTRSFVLVGGTLSTFQAHSQGILKLPGAPLLLPSVLLPGMDPFTAFDLVCFHCDWPYSPFASSHYRRMYGPFWICSTLVFVAAALGNFVAYIAHKSRHEHWNNDINQVTWSAGLFYGYVAIVPLALYFVLKYLSVPAGLVQLWCLFGYSLFVFIPASCLSVIPLEILRWVVAGAAGLMSATFLAINLRSHIKTASDRWNNRPLTLVQIGSLERDFDEMVSGYKCLYGDMCMTWCFTMCAHEVRCIVSVTIGQLSLVLKDANQRAP
eukprot:Gb_35618 [translate_table: standard]